MGGGPPPRGVPPPVGGGRTPRWGGVKGRKIYGFCVSWETPVRVKFFWPQIDLHFCVAEKILACARKKVSEFFLEKRAEKRDEKLAVLTTTLARLR